MSDAFSVIKTVENATDANCDALSATPDATSEPTYDRFVVGAWLLGLGLCAAFWVGIAVILLWPSTWNLPPSPF